MPPGPAPSLPIPNLPVKGLVELPPFVNGSEYIFRGSVYIMLGYDETVGVLFIFLRPGETPLSPNSGPVLGLENEAERSELQPVISNMGVCPKCGQTVKERQLLFTTYVGCAC